MSSWHPMRCRVCGGHADNVGRISKRGKCHRCGVRAAAEAMTQISNREGENYDKWQRGTADGARRLADRLS